MQTSPTLVSRFVEYIRKQQLFTAGDVLLLAVSGGVDSVVLCALCREAEFSFQIAHANFQLRGKESIRDETFVRQLAERYQVPLHTIRFDTTQYASIHKCSIQEAARTLRYEWFEKLLTKQSSEQPEPAPKVICTAHHLDDNIETMVMHFFRGTGIHGIRGMLPVQGRIVRPLLWCYKQNLMEFAKTQHLEWVEDSSNEEDKYTRNYFRNRLLPMAEVIFPETMGNLSRNLDRFREIELLYNQSIGAHKKKLAKAEGNELHLPVALLEKTIPLHTVLFEIISAYGFSSAQVEEVSHLLQLETGRYVESATHRIFKNRKWLVVAPRLAVAANNILIRETDAPVDFMAGHIRFERIEKQVVSKAANIATIDSALVQFPLLLRRWKSGDYFYPLGMKKKKKLARFFIDQKLSTTEKEKVWILEMNKKIIWVIGHRIDERFRILPTSRSTLRIEFIPHLELK